MEHFCFAESSLMDVDFDWGLVPNPKYDENQVNYYTGLGNSISLYGIFADFDDRGDRAQTLQMFTAVLECYASEAYRLTTPEVFEVNMQLKYSEGQDETDMFEYIRSGIVFDLGRSSPWSLTICASFLPMPLRAVPIGSICTLRMRIQSKKS